jgi:hypothetical protein
VKEINPLNPKLVKRNAKPNPPQFVIMEWIIPRLLILSLPLITGLIWLLLVI